MSGHYARTMSEANLRSVVAADMDMSAVVDLYISVGWTAYTTGRS